MELDKIVGLPAHPLLVHAAVVLIPLAAVAWIATGWRGEWRRAYLLPITLLAMGGAVAAFLAKQSGEPLAESVRRTGKRVGEHPEQGDNAFVFAMVFGLTCLALYAWQRFGESIRQRLGWASDHLPVDENFALYVISLPIAALAVWTMVVAGHSGATLVWKTNR